MHFQPELPIRERFWPGHLKWDFERTLVATSPHVVVVLTGGYDKRVWPFLRADYEVVAEALYGFVAVRRDVLRGQEGIAACLDRKIPTELGPFAWTRITSGSAWSPSARDDCRD